MSVNKEVLNLVKAACADNDEIKGTANWKDLSIDSLSFVELIVETEDKFGIAFSDEELSIYTWETVNDFVNAVEKKLKEGTNEKDTGKHKTI